MLHILNSIHFFYNANQDSVLVRSLNILFTLVLNKQNDHAHYLRLIYLRV